MPKTSRFGGLADTWGAEITRPRGSVMAGLVPAIHVGVTSNLQRRVWEHREGVADGFTRQYGLKCQRP